MGVATATLPVPEILVESACRRVGAKEQVSGRPTPPVSDPALVEVVRAVVQEVAALAQAPQIGEPVVGRVVVQVGRGQHHAGDAQPRRFQQGGPARRSAAPVAPRRGRLVKPAPVGQHANLQQMRTVAPLATSTGALEADAAA